MGNRTQLTKTKSAQASLPFFDKVIWLIDRMIIQEVYFGFEKML